MDSRLDRLIVAIELAKSRIEVRVETLLIITCSFSFELREFFLGFRPSESLS